jgi:hypothetical protein
VGEASRFGDALNRIACDAERPAMERLQWRVVTQCHDELGKRRAGRYEVRAIAPWMASAG